VNFLDAVERALERAVNGAFAKTFRSGVQPVEISSALRREMDTKASVVSRDRILVPNAFEVTLSPSDYDRIIAMGPTLVDEFSRLVTTHAKKQGYQFTGGIRISFAHDAQQTVGVCRVSSSSAAGRVRWVGTLEVSGRRYTLSPGRTVIGRGTEADVVIDDPNASRKHVEILWDGTRAQANDLGSTNGTILNGAQLRSSALPPDSVIMIGKTNIVFHVIPEAESATGNAGISGRGSA
jgi:hypothetical protein